MKKILTTMFFALCCINSMAKDYYIAGSRAMLGTTTDWACEEVNKMSVKDVFGSTCYYLIRTVTTTANNTTWKFKVTDNEGFWHSYNKGERNKTDNDNSPNANAQVKISSRGTYTLIFTYYPDNEESLDVVILAKVAGPSSYFNENWGTDMTKDAMTLGSTDNYFHLKKTYTFTGATSVEFKAVVQQRATDNNHKYWYGAANDQNVIVNIPHAGTFEVEYLFDPISKTAPWTIVRFLYYDHTIGAAGFTTFSFPRKVGVPEGVTAYYVTGHDGDMLTTATTTVIPATEGTTPQQGTGFILKGSQGTYRFVDSDATVSITGNKLYGTGANSYHDASNATYVFGQGDSDLGFFKAGGTTNETQTYAPFKAFLMASDVEGSGARSFLSVDFASVTSIAEVGMSQQTANHTYFNLQGQPVEHPTKGLYIVDGRKVVVK